MHYCTFALQALFSSSEIGTIKCFLESGNLFICALNNWLIIQMVNNNTRSETMGYSEHSNESLRWSVNSENTFLKFVIVNKYSFGGFNVYRVGIYTRNSMLCLEML